MPFIVWNDRLSVGVEALDGDHRRLVSLLNDLYDEIRGGCPREKAGEILRQLVDYTRLHFTREERLLSQTGYPQIAEHRHEHADMGAWVAETQARWDADKEAAPRLEMVNYLKDWLFDHIMGSDRQYIEHLREHGVR